MSKHKFLFKHSLPYTNFVVDKANEEDGPSESAHSTSSVVADFQSQPEQIANDYVSSAPSSSSSSIIIWNQNRAVPKYEGHEEKLIIIPSEEDNDELDDICRITPLQTTNTYPGIEDCLSIDSSASILTSLINPHASSDEIEHFYSFHDQHLTTVQQEQQQYSYTIQNDEDASLLATSNHQHHEGFSQNSNYASHSTEFCTNDQLYPVIVSQPVLPSEGGQKSTSSLDNNFPPNISGQQTSSSNNSNSTSCTTSVIKSTHRVGVITRCPASSDRNSNSSAPAPSIVQLQPQLQLPNPKTLNDESEEADVPVKISSDNQNIIIHEGDPKYECKVCRRKFKSKNNFKYHIHDTTNEIAKYKCAECGRGFIASTHYKYHLLTHTGERPYKCSEVNCSKGFLTAEKLARHMLVHNGDKPHKCSLCSRAFHHKKELEHHELTHEGQEPYCCKLCPKKFTIRSQLVIHESIHTGEEKFPCTLCSKRFVRKKHLEDHLLVHSGEKPFKCEKCNHSFRTGVALNHHLMTHSDRRPFTCECGRGFVLKKELLRHQNVHIELAVFMCKQCEKKFRRKDNLSRHIKMHHSK